MFQVTVTTDGSCSGNPGPGGYAAIITCNGAKKTVVGNLPYTTNNRMELVAVIEALKALKKPCDVQVITDSKYVIDGWISIKRYLEKENLANRDLWIQLFENSQSHKMMFVKVEGHSGHEMNEECDRLAKAEARKARARLSARPKVSRRRSHTNG